MAVGVTDEGLMVGPVDGIGVGVSVEGLTVGATDISCNDGAVLGPSHTGVLPNLPTVDVSFVKQFA